MKVRSSLSIVCLAVALLISPWNAAMAGGRTDDDFIALKAKFQAALERLQKDIGFPGATAAFILPDGRAEVFAIGWADPVRKFPMTPETRIMSGSIGKTFVAALALSLAEEGVLHLDDKIAKWLGDEPWFSGLANGSDITLRMLLNHTSGIPDYVFSSRFTKDSAELFADPDHRPSPLELIAYSLNEPALFAPGTQYAYSDTDYLLVGLILEKASKENYYHAIVQKFLYPLQLTRTSPSPGRYHPGLPQGHTTAKNFFKLPQGLSLDSGLWNIDPGVEWTGGGLVTNVRDLVYWAFALYRGRAMEGSYLDDLLAPPAPGVKYFDYFLAPPLSNAKKVSRKNGYYGLAVSVSGSGKELSYGHSGWFPGYLSTMAYYPELKVAIAFQMNTDLGGLDKDMELAGRTLANVRHTFITTLMSSDLVTP